MFSTNNLSRTIGLINRFFLNFDLKIQRINYTKINLKTCAISIKNIILASEFGS